MLRLSITKGTRSAWGQCASTRSLICLAQSTLVRRSETVACRRPPRASIGHKACVGPLGFARTHLHQLPKAIPTISWGEMRVKPLQCQRITVSSCRMTGADRQPAEIRDRMNQKTGSRCRSQGRFTFSRRTASCCRSARFSAASSTRLRRIPRINSTKMRIHLILQSPRPLSRTGELSNGFPTVDP